MEQLLLAALCPLASVRVPGEGAEQMTYSPTAAPLSSVDAVEQPLTWAMDSAMPVGDSSLWGPKKQCKDHYARYCDTGKNGCYRDITGIVAGWGHGRPEYPELMYCCDHLNICCGAGSGVCCDRHSHCQRNCSKSPEEPHAYLCTPSNRSKHLLAASEELGWERRAEVDSLIGRLSRASSGSSDCLPSSWHDLVNLESMFNAGEATLQPGDVEVCHGKCCEADQHHAYVGGADAVPTRDGVYCCAHCCGGVCAPPWATCCYAPERLLPRGVATSAYCNATTPTCCAAVPGSGKPWQCCSAGSDCCGSCGGPTSTRCCGGCTCCGSTSTCHLDSVCVDSEATFRVVVDWLWRVAVGVWLVLGSYVLLRRFRSAPVRGGYEEIAEKRICDECGAAAHCGGHFRAQNSSAACPRCLRLGDERGDCHAGRAGDVHTNYETTVIDQEEIRFKVVHRIQVCRQCQCSKCMPVIDCRWCRCDDCIEHQRFVFCPAFFFCVTGVVLLAASVTLVVWEDRDGPWDVPRAVTAALWAVVSLTISIWSAFFKPHPALGRLAR